MASQLKPFVSRLKRYLSAYGGWEAIFRSPLFLISLILTMVGYANWLDDQWSSVSQALIPNLLGFSLGTYAILFSLMTSRLKRALKAVKNDRGTSYLDEINATFFHFIFIQVTALLWAFVYRGTALRDLLLEVATRWDGAPCLFRILYVAGGFIGHLLLIYSIALIIGAVLAVYRLALIVDPTDS